MYALRLAVTLTIAAAAAACGPADPHEELRQLAVDAEAAAEQRSSAFFRNVLSPSYRDARGHDRDALLTLVRGYLLAHSDIEIISTVDEVVLEGDDAARMVLLAGMAGRRKGQSLLGGVGGNLYRIELELVKDGSDWHVIGARWQPAMGER